MHSLTNIRFSYTTDQAKTSSVAINTPRSNAIHDEGGNAMTTFETLIGQTGYHASTGIWRRIMDRLRAFDALHRERAGLEKLDDRTLRDIGLTRGDIARALRQPEAHYALILRRADKF
jgi:uncharacterized protein YjiS (DUF1127 family)